jgi:rhamnosyltransferase
LTDAVEVSVVIPTRNGGARFREVLTALDAQEIEGGFELVVVDSSSTDGTVEAAAAAGAVVERISPADFNHGATRNLGIARSRGRLVALLTHDSVPIGRDYLQNLLRPFERANVDGVYARQYPRPDCDPLLAERLRRWSASRSVPELNLFVPGDAEGSRKLYDKLPPMERFLSCAFDNVASAVRRSTWERIPFPERTFGEDVAWGREVLLAGGAIAFEPSACVEHSHRIRMFGEFQRIYCDHRNLNDLFEVFTVHSWHAVRHGWSSQRRFYAELLDELHLPARERLFWKAYAVPYAFLETAAQFLGARSNWKTQESRRWRWFDRRIRGA